jgi:hypothetical protein
MSKLTYLVEACKLGDMKTVTRFLETKGVNPTYKNNAALHAAVFNGHLDIVKALLQDSRVNDNISDKNKAIVIASENGRTDVVDYLLQDLRLLRVDPTEAIDVAFSNKHFDVVDRLLKDFRIHHAPIAIMRAYDRNFDTDLTTIDPSLYDNWLIRRASELGDIKTVNYLLNDSRVDPSAVNNNAVRMASKNGHNEVVERLLLDDRVELIDYPFRKWEDYYRAFVCLIYEDDYEMSENYPEYYLYNQNGGDDCEIMMRLLSEVPESETPNSWAQEGLDGFIEACISTENIMTSEDIRHFYKPVAEMIKMGAFINLSLVSKKDEDDDEDDDEDNEDDEDDTVAHLLNFFKEHFNVFQ